MRKGYILETEYIPINNLCGIFFIYNNSHDIS